MKLKLINKLLLFYLFLFFLQNNSLAQEYSPSVNLYATLVDRHSVEGELEPRIYKKYQILKLEIQNKTDDILYLPARAFYTNEKGQKIRVESAELILKKLKKHPIRRAVIISIPVTVLTWGIFTIPAFAASCLTSSSYNSRLQANINKNIYKVSVVPDRYTQEFYVFIPKKHKNLDKLIIENLYTDSLEPFTVEAKIEKESY